MIMSLCILYAYLLTYGNVLLTPPCCFLVLPDAPW
jgi:hypothetical protein